MITIYGKTNCGWCEKAKNLLNIKRIDYNYIQPDKDILLTIAEQYGVKTVPIIVDDNRNLIGGYMELEKYLAAL